MYKQYINIHGDIRKNRKYCNIQLYMKFDLHWIPWYAIGRFK